jgi:hypothetical protein
MSWNSIWPTNTHNYPYRVAYSVQGSYVYEHVVYSNQPCTVSEAGVISCPGNVEYYARQEGMTNWTYHADYPSGSFSASPLKEIFEANYAIGSYTPPPQWNVRMTQIKGDADSNLPVNTYGYPLWVRCADTWNEYVFFSEQQCGYNGDQIYGTGNAEYYGRAKGTAEWIYHNVYTTSFSLSGITEILEANYSIGSYVPSELWNTRIARIYNGTAWVRRLVRIKA